jgi:predicted RNA-binding Zn-ribbon protein involved in translation (DUF1610 family)
MRIYYNWEENGDLRMTTATAKKNYRKPYESTVIKSGVSRSVIVSFCPNCGLTFGKEVTIQSTATRFKCPECHTSIENTRQNRCPVCGVIASDSETAKVHLWNGCPNAGTLFPGGLRFRKPEGV